MWIIKNVRYNTHPVYRLYLVGKLPYACHNKVLGGVNLDIINVIGPCYILYGKEHNR